MIEKVNPSHPDKVADRIAGAIVDLAYTKENDPKIAVEVLIGHGECNIIIETSVEFKFEEVDDIVKRIAGNLTLYLSQVPQDVELAKNQENEIRCGDNGIFKGVPLTDNEKLIGSVARNIYDRKDIEPNVPSIDSRYKFYKDLKDRGFKVGIRIQPFLPNITDLELVKMFKDADNFTLEGIKIVPQNKEHKEYILNVLNLDKDCFTQMGLLNLKPSIRLEMYRPFIDYFNENNIPFSIADNDLHYIGTNKCCCGDRLVSKSTDFNNTAMLKKYGKFYTLEDIKQELGNCSNCKCNHLFTSNRQEGCRTVSEFYNKRFDRKTSPFSPKFQYYKNLENEIDLSCLD